MQQGQFGRRRAILNGTLIAADSPTPRQVRPARERPAYVNSDGTFNGWRWVVTTLVITIIAIAWVEALFSGTALITQLDETVLWTMRGLGAAIGLGVGLLLFAKIAQENSTAKAVLTVLVMPLMFGFLFDGIAWRAADWASFGFSQQAFEPARYPIDSISPGRKGRRDVIEIDPFDTGEHANIPMSDAQYRELITTPASYCVTVMQRREPSGAIEILTDGEYTLHEPAPVEVGPCDGSSATSESSSNPWSRE
jgi:hypothetical protein